MTGRAVEGGGQYHRCCGAGVRRPFPVPSVTTIMLVTHMLMPATSAMPFVRAMGGSIGLVGPGQPTRRAATRKLVDCPPLVEDNRLPRFH